MMSASEAGVKIFCKSTGFVEDDVVVFSSYKTFDANRKFIVNALFYLVLFSAIIH